MKLLNKLRPHSPIYSADIARERLQIIIAHERKKRSSSDYLPSMHEDILNVIRKYVHVKPDNVTVHITSEESTSILELNIILPEKE